MDKVLIAGPWFGEFGGELEDWHAYLRFLSHNQYKDHYFVASSFPGRAPFYEFADEFWGLPDWFMNQISNQTYFTRWASLVNSKTGKLVPTEDELIQKVIAWQKERAEKAFPSLEIEYLQPHLGIHPMNLEAGRTMEYKLIQVELDVDVQDHIVIFPRQRLNEKFRNWDMSKWEILVRRLILDGHTVVSCGTRYETGELKIDSPKFIDILGADLATQVAYMQTAKLAITPICGAVRFAAFTGTPTLTFGHKGYLDSLPRAEGKPLWENPFGTKLYMCMKNTWKIQALEVYESAKGILSK